MGQGGENEEMTLPKALREGLQKDPPGVGCALLFALFILLAILFPTFWFGIRPLID